MAVHLAPASVPGCSGYCRFEKFRARDVQAVALGDLIWEPERAHVAVWQHLHTLVTVAAQVATVIIAVRR